MVFKRVVGIIGAYEKYSYPMESKSEEELRKELKATQRRLRKKAHSKTAEKEKSLCLKPS